MTTAEEFKARRRHHVRRLMSERGITSIDLAAKLGVCRNTVARWRDGERPQSDEMTVKLAEALGVDAGVFTSAVKP